MDPDTPRTLPEDDDELMEIVAEAILSVETQKEPPPNHTV